MQVLFLVLCFKRVFLKLYMPRNIGLRSVIHSSNGSENIIWLTDEILILKGSVDRLSSRSHWWISHLAFFSVFHISFLAGCQTSLNSYCLSVSCHFLEPLYRKSMAPTRNSIADSPKCWKYTSKFHIEKVDLGIIWMVTFRMYN